MKKLILITVCFLSLLFTGTAKDVKAISPTYMRVLKNDIYIYQDVNLSKKLFIVPYGYFVVIEKDLGSFVKVNYMQSTTAPTIIGYMYKDDLTTYASMPTSPFCNLTVTNKISDILFNDSDKSIPYFNVAENSSLTYYGELVTNNNETLVYCYYNLKLGYIDKTSLNTYQVPQSSDIIVTLPNTPSNNDNVIETQKPTTENNESLQIIIIVGISVISISVVYFLFKPTKNKIETNIDTLSEYYDE